MAYQAEYIWIDGTEPTPLLRSKTKILKDGKEPPIWGFDGSSTNQAPGDKSDCALIPVFSCPDPIRGGNNILVLCEVYNAKDGKPHPTNTRAACVKTQKKFAKHEMIFGIEQEYTFLKLDGSPLGFPANGFPAPQGPYYCGVGAGRVVAREIIEEHTQACIDAGLMIEGTNAEVMPGQWEFQIGAADALTVSDHLTVARWLLHRIAEDYDENAWVTKPVSQGGAGFDSQWDWFVHSIRGVINQAWDTNRDMPTVRDAITHAYNGNHTQRVIYVESHDEDANGKQQE